MTQILQINLLIHHTINNMPLDYNKVQTYYEILMHFKNGTKKYTLRDRASLDIFLNKAKSNQTIISYVIYRVQKSIYTYQ